MGRLSIDLKEGFKNDTVVIAVNGREVYRNANVSTRYQIGRADLVELDTDQGSAVVEISVPSKGASKRLEVDVASKPFIGIRLTPDGTIEHQEKAEPFYEA